LARKEIIRQMPDDATLTGGSNSEIILYQAEDGRNGVELRREATVAEYATVQNEGGRSVFRHQEYDKQDGQK
jgi:hypothetical protein